MDDEIQAQRIQVTLFKFTQNVGGAGIQTRQPDINTSTINTWYTWVPINTSKAFYIPQPRLGAPATDQRDLWLLTKHF